MAPGDDQIGIGMANRACDMAGNGGHFEHVQQQPADLRVVTVDGPRRAFKEHAKGVVGKEQIDRPPNRRCRHAKPELVETIPEALDVHVHARQKLGRIELVGRQHAQWRRHRQLPLARTPRRRRRSGRR
jgi:hypothetical protein